jgi:hypothetical protein
VRAMKVFAMVSSEQAGLEVEGAVSDHRSGYKYSGVSSMEW